MSSDVSTQQKEKKKTNLKVRDARERSICQAS